VRHGCDKTTSAAHIMAKATDISNLKRVKPGEMIRAGSIWMPIENLPHALAPFTKLLFCLTGSEDHPYSLRGSATGLKFQDQHLLFCCLHQIADRSPHEIVVPVDKRGRKLVSGTSFIRVNDLPEFAGEELLDVCAMHFNPLDYGDRSSEEDSSTSKGRMSGTEKPKPHSWCTATRPSCARSELMMSPGPSTT
jgi:hypothetical protein